GNGGGEGGTACPPSARLPGSAPAPPPPPSEGPGPELSASLEDGAFAIMDKIGTHGPKLAALLAAVAAKPEATEGTRRGGILGGDNLLPAASAVKYSSVPVWPVAVPRSQKSVLFQPSTKASPLCLA